MTTIPTPADFLMSRDPDEEEEYDVPFEQNAARLDDLERRIHALEMIAQVEGLAPAAPDTTCPECVACREDAEHSATRAETAEVRAAGAESLIEQIEAIVKKSTSKVSLEVKAAIEEWRRPEAAEAEPEPEQEPEGHISKAEREQMMGGFVGRPTHDADVEAWRSYARSQGYTGTDVDTMNRSQIRTMLGITHPDAQTSAVGA